MIETSSSSSDSDNNVFDSLRLMDDTQDKSVRLAAYGKIKKMLKDFKVGSVLEPLDRNLMRGLFKR